MHPLHFYFSKNGWRVFGLFVCYIAIYLHMGIYFGQPLLRSYRVLLLRIARYQITNVHLNPLSTGLGKINT